MKIGGERYLLGDDIYTPVIKGRILEITQYFVKREIISREEIAEMLVDEEIKIDKFFTEKELLQLNLGVIGNESMTILGN